MRSVNFLLTLVLLVSLVITPEMGYANSIARLNLPEVGAMVMPSVPFVPVLLKGIKIDKNNPLQFEFLVDSGQGDDEDEDQIKKETQRLVRYFLASLTVPEEDLWVNLSPYEGDRVVAEGFGQTDMGRDLLAQDYLLKQLTSSLMYPEGEVGKVFWKKIRKKVFEKHGITDISVGTFHKVWIVPGEAKVFENGSSGIVIKSSLKVMMENDYLAMNVNEGGQGEGNGISYQIMKETILPAIEKEVNEGKNFVKLRQIYNSLILAKWYKQTIKNGILNEVYVGKSKMDGLEVEDKKVYEKIYERYVASYKKGVFDYVEEEYDENRQSVIPKKYFSGGVKFVDSGVIVTRNEENVNQLNGSGFYVKMEMGAVNEEDKTVYDLSMLSRPEEENNTINPNKDHNSKMLELWKTATTDPNKHNPDDFRYIIHAVGETRDMLTMEKYFNKKELISTSYIDKTHTATYGYEISGFILGVPVGSILSTGNEDLIVRNHKSIEAFVKESLLKRKLTSPDIILEKTSKVYHNEIVIQGHSLENILGKVKIIGIFYKEFSFDPNISNDPEKMKVLINIAQKYNVPLIVIEKKEAIQTSSMHSNKHHNYYFISQRVSESFQQTLRLDVNNDTGEYEFRMISYEYSMIPGVNINNNYKNRLAYDLEIREFLDIAEKYIKHYTNDEEMKIVYKKMNEILDRDNSILDETTGGIDFKTMDVMRSGEGIEMDVSDMNKVLGEGFIGFNPKIITIKPMLSVSMFLGLKER